MHPIMAASFAQIDAEFGPHTLSPEEYAVVRRVIHSTADFDYRHLLKFGAPNSNINGQHHPIQRACQSLQAGAPIIVDVTMVEQGVQSMVQRTFQNPLISAVAQAEVALPGKTRTETGLLRCLEQYPEGIYVIGNAPTALLALGKQIRQGKARPRLVVGAPVGFISVLESKAELASLMDTPQIRVEGRKGGSPVAAAIINALLVLAANAGAGGNSTPPKTHVDHGDSRQD